MKVIVTRSNQPTTTGPRTGRELAIAGDGKPPPATPSPPVTPPSAPVPPRSDLNLWTERAVALVPTEITALFVAVMAAIASVPDPTVKYAPAVILILCAMLTVVQLHRLGQSLAPPVKPLRRQYVFAVLAFLAWGCSIADPFEAWDRVLPRWIVITAIAIVPFGGAATFGKE